MKLKLVPRPRHLENVDGTFAIGAVAQIQMTSRAEPLAGIMAREWRRETGNEATVNAVDDDAFFFSVGDTDSTPPVPDHPEGYALQIVPHGIAGRAGSYEGLVHAWQTLKQILRHNTTSMPCLRIRDWPDLRWRIYHVDLKGTRRNVANLHDILPQLAEFKVNAILAEYEDFIRLERHPELAIPGALTQDDVRDWVRAAKAYGIAVIPLVQTLGHWQYILGREKYAHLREHPGDTTTGCPSHPETWDLATDFLDEIMALHPDAPFIHVGLDETFQLGKCDACRERLNGRPPNILFTEWTDRICAHVVAGGSAPMLWADMVNSFDEDMGRRLNRDALYVDWGYMNSGPAHYDVDLHRKKYLSREWLHRPEGEIDTLPELYLRGLPNVYEDLPNEERARLKPYVDNPAFPKKLRIDTRMAWLKELNVRRGAVSGIRVSYHGSIAPRFIHGQLNTLSWADICRRHEASVLIGSSWSRGHSFARINAHCELDWYGIATLGDAGWQSLRTDELRHFDERFAFQFFGSNNGHVGDLFFLFDRSSRRADDVMDNFFEYIADECRRMMPEITRNQARFRLFTALTELQVLRFKIQAAILEFEYFYLTRDAVPEAFKESMLKNIADLDIEAGKRIPQLRELYRETLIDTDAEELAKTQLAFLRENLMAMKDIYCR